MSLSRGEQGKTRAARHLHIEEDHIGMDSLNQIDAGLHAVGLADDFDAGMHGEAFSQVHAHGLLIVHKHSTDRAISDTRIHGK
jgi:hypothetical protein